MAGGEMNHTPVEVLPPGRDLIARVAQEILSHSPCSFKDIEIIFPGERPGMYLLRYLATQINAPFVPPRVFSFERYLKTLYSTQIAPELQEANAFEEISALSKTMRGLGISSDPLPLTMNQLREIVGLFEELKMALISQPEELLRYSPWENFEVFKGVPLREILAGYNLFYQELFKNRRFTRSCFYEGVYRRFTDLNFEERQLIIFAGFPATPLTRVEQELFRAFSRLPQVRIFVEGNSDLPPSPHGPGPSSDDRKGGYPQIKLLKARDPHLLLLGIIQFLEEIPKSERYSPETAVIVLPSERIMPLLHLYLDQLSYKEYNISLPFPLSHTPLGRFLHLLFELLSLTKKEGEEGSLLMPRPSLHNLLLHPYIQLFIQREKEKGSGSPAEGSSLPSKGLPFHSWVHLHPGKFPILDRIRERFFDPIISITSGEEFSIRLKEILDTLNELGINEPLFAPVREALLYACDEFRTAGLGCISLTAAELPLFYRHFSEELFLHFSGTPLQGIQVLGVLEARSLSFKNLVFFGINDEVLPGDGLGSVYFPEELKISLGLPSREARNELLYLTLKSAVSRAERVLFAYIETLREGELSRFVQRLLWEERDYFLGGGETFSEEEFSLPYTTLSHLPNPIGKNQETLDLLEDFTYTPTALDTFLRCPLRFYYQDILHLPTPKGEHPRLDLGDLLHNLLLKFYLRVRGKEERILLTPSLLRDDLLEEVVSQHFQEVEENSASAKTLRTQLFQENIKDHLKSYLIHGERRILKYYEELGLPVYLLGLEENLGPIWLEKFRLSGRVDRREMRCEKGDSSTLWIIDYKLWNEEKAKQHAHINFEQIQKIPLDNLPSVEDFPQVLAELYKHLPSVQLLVYGVLAQSLARGMSIVPAYHILDTPFHEHKRYEFSLQEKKSSSQKKGGRGNEGLTPVAPPTPPELIAAGKKILLYLLQCIEHPELPFIPTPEPEKNCPTCPFTSLCGTTWTRSSNRG